ncbi:MAG: LytR/AlgR family response regulator transcription factor [Runella sp.]
MAKILIVEDEIITVTLLEEALEARHHEVVATLTDCTYLKHFLPQADLLIIDIHLGFHLAFDLLEADTLEEIPIIFITQYADEQAYLKSLRFDFSTFLVKPIHPLTLASTIELLLEKKKSTHPLVLKDGRQQNVLQWQDIRWIEVEGNYITIKTTHSKHTLKKSLAQIKASLDDDLFIQVHRNYIVLIEAISEINLTEGYVLVDKQKISLSRHFRPILKQRLQYLFD